MIKNSSLTIVGSGIKFMSHLTIEAKAHIEHADIILYLVNEPAMREWLMSLQARALSLENHYQQHTFRQDTYHAITETILHSLDDEKHVCVVLEGHPTVFAQSALSAAKQAKQRGMTVTILPGISADAYLFAELHIDPGSTGCLSYEATDFLIYKRLVDAASHLILWQVSVIGMLKNNAAHCHRAGTQILVDRLSEFYDLEHEVILFEGSQYPHIASKIERLTLANLTDATISRITTLYIPPIYQRTRDLSMLKKLGLA